MTNRISNVKELKKLRDQFKTEMEVRCIPEHTQNKHTLRECCDECNSKSKKTNQS